MPPQRTIGGDRQLLLAEPAAQALGAQEWVLTQPLGGALQPNLDAMFARAGVTPPTLVVCCETLAAMTLLRHSDGVSIFPEPLLGHAETRGLVAIEPCPLVPGDVEVLLLSQADVPQTPAAAYFAHCLAAVCAEVAARQDRR